MKNIHELLLTFFYTGKAKKAPGSVGSIVALLFWFLLTNIFFTNQISVSSQNIFWGIFLTISFVYGCIASPIYTKKFHHHVDHSSIVLDEVVGQILALQFTFFFINKDYFSDNGLILAHLTFCYLSFRFFDIIKPSFIGWLDRNLKNGFGVMFDDLVSGAVTAAIGYAIIVLA